MTEILKRLSRNDLGQTGSHQAGIVIPKSPIFLNFFPWLDPEEINPRRRLLVEGPLGDKQYELTYVYYNGKITGTSSRNEYRLTGLTAFFRDSGATEGDFLRIAIETEGKLVLSIEPKDQSQMNHSDSNWLISDEGK